MDIVQKFIKENKHKYPYLTQQQLKDICESPFKYMKEVFKKPELPEYRLKYLGTFKPRPSNMFSYLHKLKAQFEKELITEEEYIKRSERIKNKIKYYEDHPY